MLRASGSEVKHFRGKIHQIIHVIAVFGLCVLRVTAGTRSISRFFTAHTAILAVFRSSILWSTAALGVLWGWILRNTVCTWSIQGSRTARTLSTRSISAFRSANTFNSRTISGFHTGRCSNTRSISGFCTATYCWLEYYSEYSAWMLKYFGVQYPGYSEYSKYFRCLYCGYCLYSRICTARAPSTRSI